MYDSRLGRRHGYVPFEVTKTWNTLLHKELSWFTANSYAPKKYTLYTVGAYSTVCFFLHRPACCSVVTLAQISPGASSSDKAVELTRQPPVIKSTCMNTEYE